MAVEELLEESQEFDAVVASEVIEHVGDQSLFIKTCSELTKVNSYMFSSLCHNEIKQPVLFLDKRHFLLILFICF